MNVVKYIIFSFALAPLLLVNANTYNFTQIQKRSVNQAVLESSQDTNSVGGEASSTACPLFTTIYTNGITPGTTTIYPTSISTSGVSSNNIDETSVSSESIITSTITTTITSGSQLYTTTITGQNTPVDTVEVVIPTAGTFTTTLTSGSSYPVATTTVRTASGTQSGEVEVITPSCGCSPENSFHLKIDNDKISPSYVYMDPNAPVRTNGAGREGNMFASTNGDNEGLNLFYYDSTIQRVLTCDCQRPSYTVYIEDPIIGNGFSSAWNLIKNSDGTFTPVESRNNEPLHFHVDNNGRVWMTSQEYDTEVSSTDERNFRANDVTLQLY
ncbi:putative cell agglutination protein pfl9 [Schizosaccharomyces pombe]